MGYRREPTIYRLTFPDDYPGLEVFAKSVSIEEYLKIAKLADVMTTKPGEDQITELFTWFARRLVKWNIEDEDGKAVPATLKSLMAEELPFAMKLVMEWVNRVVGVSAPLPTASAAGASSPDPVEATIPMTPMDGSSSPPS